MPQSWGFIATPVPVQAILLPVDDIVVDVVDSTIKVIESGQYV